MIRFFDTDGITVKLLSPQGMAAKGIIPSGKAWFITQQPLRFQSDIAHGVITVPTGYLTDMASIPKLSQGIFMLHDDPMIAMPSFVHDFLYQFKGRISVFANDREMPVLLSRQECDAILCHEGMADLGATRTQIDTVYNTLRTVGDGWGDNYPLSERFHL